MIVTIEWYDQLEIHLGQGFIFQLRDCNAGRQAEAD